MDCIAKVKILFIDDGDKVTKRGRTGTVLTHVWNLPEGKRIVVKCNQLGQPIGKEGGLLGKFLGTIARNGGYCPLHVNDWRKVKNDNAATILQCIQVRYILLDTGTKLEVQ